MAYSTKKNPVETVAFKFRKLLNHQDFIENLDLYDEYSVHYFYRDVCSILKNDKYLQEKPLLKKVT